MDALWVLGKYMKKRLVFVDDDANILKRLRRVLRCQQDDWDMHFARSYAVALKIINDADGYRNYRYQHAGGEWGPVIRACNGPPINYYPNDLFGLFRIRFDHEVRGGHPPISLKALQPGYTEIDHNQAAESRTLLRDENLKSLIPRLKALPCVPALCREISKELQSPEASINKVGEIISQDPSIGANLPQLSNLAFFGRRHSMSKITAAVAFLGSDCVAKLLLAIHAFEEFMPAMSGLIYVGHF